MKDPKVNYADLRRACAEAREAHPHAHAVRPALVGGLPRAEVEEPKNHVRLWIPEWAR